MTGPASPGPAAAPGLEPPLGATLGMDPITFEVLRNAFLNATEEMAFALRRAAYSTNIKTRADFSCAFFDREGRCVVQSFSQPPHLASLKHMVPRAGGEYGVERKRPKEDVWDHHERTGSSEVWHGPLARATAGRIPAGTPRATRWRDMPYCRVLTVGLSS